ncbi:MAG: NAD(P)H-hydrate dehydratase [Phyllobacterium sp.]
MHELLTPKEMGDADRLSIERGPFSGFQLMLRAGSAVTSSILKIFPAARRVAVLCGPGNNGGDGYVVAEQLAGSGVETVCFCSARPKPSTDAERAAQNYRDIVLPLASFRPEGFDLVVDGLFGAGLARDVSGLEKQAIDSVNVKGTTVVAIDLPSGVSGETGRVLGASLSAALTVTFFRKKPGHILEPGRSRCGAQILADIGILPTVLEHINPRCFENAPAVWGAFLPKPEVMTHKYRRGAVGVFSGGPYSTGAARLSALAAARSGAGAVTILSPSDALAINACHLTSIMLRKTDVQDDLTRILRESKIRSFVLGPGFGDNDKARDFVSLLLQSDMDLVLDADGITAFEDHPASLFDLVREKAWGAVVLTPHEGEFHRVFPKFAMNNAMSKVEKARAAAKLSNSIIIYKGPDSVIAAPDGRATINGNGNAYLATAGSGDVLAGVVAGLLAQGMPPFEAACAGVWIHAEAGKQFGPGLIAEDFPAQLPKVFQELLAVG